MTEKGAREAESACSLGLRELNMRRMSNRQLHGYVVDYFTNSVGN
jgi:hypothetical protein